MPELPEVETCRQGLLPHLKNAKVTRIQLYRDQLRLPINPEISEMIGEKIIDIQRRGKYLIFSTKRGNLILHLGMSGRIKILDKNIPREKHDHVDIEFHHRKILRYNDTRRFGLIVWHQGDVSQHPLLKNLGIEPLSEDFNGEFLFSVCQKSKKAIKLLMMDHQIVVGVGNIYANESLYLAKIHPEKISNTLSLENCNKLVQLIKKVLQNAITKGGTTLKDFINTEGKPGYFQLELHVYGKQNQSCSTCKSKIKMIRLGQRSTFYCPGCQKK